MHQKENPASAGTLGGIDCKAQQQSNPYTLPSRENKANATGSKSRRLNRVAAHWAAAVPDTMMSRAFLAALQRKSIKLGGGHAG